MDFRKVTSEDSVETGQLFNACLRGLLAREQIAEEGLLENEVDRLQKAVQDSFTKRDHLFFVAEKDGKIIGTIALQPVGSLIDSAVETESGSLEVACVYVHPGYQRQGVGKFLFHNALKKLRKLGHPNYYLDAGFSSSQRYWRTILGEPDFVLENYWGDGKHHLFWKRKL